MAKESGSWWTWGAQSVGGLVLTAIVGWLIARWNELQGMAQAFVAALGALIGLAVLHGWQHTRRRRVERERSGEQEARVAAESAAAIATARAEKAEAELDAVSQAEVQRRELEASQWPAARALRTEFIPHTNVGADHFHGQSKYGNEFANVATLVLSGSESRLQFSIRMTNLAPFAVTPVGMQLDQAVVHTLHGLRLKAVALEVLHTYKELAPGGSDTVRVLTRAVASQSEAADSAHIAVTGRVFVRSERWRETQEASISTSSWGIVVDERQRPPWTSSHRPTEALCRVAASERENGAVGTDDRSRE